MKKIFTLTAILVVSLLNAQVFSEDFSDGVPGSMNEVLLGGAVTWEDCGGDLGGIPCPGGVATFYHASSSPFNAALDTPALDLSSGVYKVTFTLAKREKEGKVNEFTLEISTDGGSNYVEVHDFQDEIFEPTNYTFVLTEYGLTDQTIIRFRSKNRRGYATYLDNISVKEVIGDDLGVAVLDIPGLIITGPTEVRGTLTNYGVNPVTSFDINWSVNGGAAHTQHYSGQHIASGQNFNFTHQDLWDAEPGMNSFRIWISNMNITDTDPDNDEIIKEINVASGVSIKIPIFEKFTASTCGPCGPYNIYTFDPFMENYAHDKVTMVSYQTNFPGAGDPYYIPEVFTRRQYYGVGSVPTLVYQGTVIDRPGMSYLINLVDESIADDRYSFYDIEAHHEISGDMITVNADITAYLEGNFNVLVNVFEKTTYNNTGSNGQTEFHHVLMAPLAGANGTAMSLTQGETQQLTFTHDMSTTNVEEMDDLAVVVFLQDSATKEILNSRYTLESGIPLGTNDLAYSNTVELAPNPTTGIVRVYTEKPVSVMVYDLTGKAVHKANSVANNDRMNLSHLAKGVYIVTLTDDKGVETVKKLIIK